MNTIGQFFRMVAEALGIVAKRQELKNAADVKAAAKAQQEREGGAQCGAEDSGGGCAVEDGSAKGS